MIVRTLSRHVFDKAFFGLAAVSCLAACDKAPAPATAATGPSVEEQAAEAKARAKAEREARLASFYGGGSPAGEPSKPADADKDDGEPSSPPANVEPPNAAPLAPTLPNAPAPPDPGGPPIQ